MNSEDSALLRGLVPLNTLPEEDLLALIERLEVKTVAAGELLFRAGDTDTGHVYLLAGKIDLLSGDGVVVDVVVAGAAKARFPIAHRIPREYSARARGEVRYVIVGAHHLGCLVEKDRRSALSRSADAGDADWIGKLLQSRVFQSLPKEDLKAILHRMETIEAHAGEVLIEEGGAGDYFYLIDRGEAEVLRGDSRLALLASGDMFGEEALLGDTPRGATVRMRTDGTLLRLDKESFRRLVRLPALRRCDPDEAVELLETGCMLLDVREPGLFADDHPSGSINLPLDSLRYQATSLSHERCYLVCAESLNRALVAAYLLTERGFNVAALDGDVAELPLRADSLVASDGGEGLAEVSQAPREDSVEADLKLQLDELKARLEAADRRVAELVAQRDALRESLEQARVDSSDSASRGGIEQELAAQKAQVEALQAELTLLRRLESDARNEAGEARAENARLQEALRERKETPPSPAPMGSDGRELRRSQLDLEYRLGVAEEALAVARKRLVELQQQRDREVASLSDRVALLESQLADSGRAIIDANNRYSEAEQAYQARIAELEQQLAACGEGREGAVDKETEALLWRADELEAAHHAAEEEIAELRRQVRASEEESNELRSVLETYVSSIEALKSELQMVREQAEMEYQSMSTELHQVKERHGEGPSLSVQLENLRQELDAARQALRESEEAVEAAHEERHFLEDSLEDRDRELDELGARLAELEARLHETQARLDEKDAELERVESALGACQREYENIRAIDLRDPRLEAANIQPKPANPGVGLLGLLTGILLTLAAAYGSWRLGWLPAASRSGNVEEKPRPVSRPAPSPAAVARHAKSYLPERGGPVSAHAKRDRLRDGSFGPAMRELSGSRFPMGSDASWAPANARPRHVVSVGPFWIADREVTNAEYRRFARATHRPMPLSSAWSGDDLPVTGVSWDDADAYATWLSEQTGRHYRLPSESEWEYAASGGAGTRYWWGDKPETGHENCADCGTRYDDRQPAPVGSFDANGYGLYDVAGNVMEWVGDCYRRDYQVPLARADCRQHMFRGGSFHRPLAELYVLNRGHGAPDLRSPYLGFRVARDGG